MSCSEADFDYLRQIVRSETAIILDPARSAQMAMRLLPVAKEAGRERLEDLVDLLRVEGRSKLRRAVAEAMTINETSFFRDITPFNAMRDVILPALIRRNAQSRTLRIWSAACSTGQEAYSVAMLLRESFPEVAATWDVKIVGTDISRPVVEYARAGRYKRLEVNRGLPARLLLKYTRREQEEWIVKEAARGLCSFENINLCAPPTGLPRFDLVLLRNVLLYFSGRDRGVVLSHVHDRLAPEGYLVLGAAEQAEDSSDQFRAEFSRDCYFYRPVTIS